MKSSAYPPLDGLVDLACRDGVDVRPTLLRVLTDLYVQKPTHSGDEVTQYVELALGLIDTVDDATRAAVAASLSRYPAAPPAVLAKLGAASPNTGQATAGAATPAAGHQDIGTESLADLFFSASSEDRRLILLNLDAAATGSVHLPPASGAVIQRLENAALQRNTAEFNRELSRALNIPPDLANRVARDPLGEPIVVAAKALGMKAAVLQRILLILNPSVGQSVQRVYDLADLFDALSREAAEIILTIWRQDSVAAAPVYEPVYRDGQIRNVRAQPTQTRVRSSDEKPGRLKSTR